LLSRDILPGQRLNSPVLRGFIAKRLVEWRWQSPCVKREAKRAYLIRTRIVFHV